MQSRALRAKRAIASSPTMRLNIPRVIASDFASANDKPRLAFSSVNNRALFLVTAMEEMRTNVGCLWISAILVSEANVEISPRCINMLPSRIVPSHTRTKCSIRAQGTEVRGLYNSPLYNRLTESLLFPFFRFIPFFRSLFESV